MSLDMQSLITLGKRLIIFLSFLYLTLHTIYAKDAIYTIDLIPPSKCLIERPEHCGSLVGMINEFTTGGNWGLIQNIWKLSFYSLVIIFGYLAPYFLFITVLWILITVFYRLKTGNTHKKWKNFSLIFFFLTILSYIINLIFTVLLQ